MHRFFPALALAAAVICAHPAAAQAPTPTPSPSLADSAADPDGWGAYDFLIGDWTVTLRKLEKPLSGSNVWLEYKGTSKTRKIAGGRGNLEDFDVSTRDGKRIDGQTLRLYNPDSGEWSIYLLNAAKGQLLLPATIGKFRSGRGELYDYEVFNGRATFVRYTWTQEGRTKARFVQAFSVDGGRTWEDNWISEQTRE